MGLSKLPRIRRVVFLKCASALRVPAFAPARFRAPGTSTARNGRELRERNFSHCASRAGQAIWARGPTSPLGRYLVESKPLACRFAPSQKSRSFLSVPWDR